jgi:hypothetical protein
VFTSTGATIRLQLEMQFELSIWMTDYRCAEQQGRPSAQWAADAGSPGEYRSSATGRRLRCSNYYLWVTNNVYSARSGQPSAHRFMGPSSSAKGPAAPASDLRLSCLCKADGIVDSCNSSAALCCDGDGCKEHGPASAAWPEVLLEYIRRYCR